MMHVVLGSLVGLIAITLVMIAIILTPKLEIMGFKTSSRWAFAVMLISLAAYLGWIVNLFYQDELGPINYSAELIILRVVALAAAFWFLVAAFRCNGPRWPRK